MYMSVKHSLSQRMRRIFTMTAWKNMDTLASYQALLNTKKVDLAHAMSGELEKAKAEIARSRAECSPMGHECLLLFLLHSPMAFRNA